MACAKLVVIYSDAVFIGYLIISKTVIINNIRTYQVIPIVQLIDIP